MAETALIRTPNMLALRCQLSHAEQIAEQIPSM
jgi:hypothetical protein